MVGEDGDGAVVGSAEVPFILANSLWYSVQSFYTRCRLCKVSTDPCGPQEARCTWLV